MDFPKTEHQFQVDLKLTETMPIEHENGGLSLPPTSFSFSEPIKGTLNGHIFSARLLMDGSIVVNFYTEAGGMPDSPDERGEWKLDLGNLLNEVLGQIAVTQKWVENREGVKINERS